MIKKIWFIILTFILIANISFAGLRSESWSVPPDLPEFKVINVVDGDTIKVEKLGSIRYIGVNTPELHHPQKGQEPFGREAMEINKKLVASKKVKLQLDTQERDRYGRILAYVYIDSIFINAYLVEAGYAQVMTVPPNVRYASLFQKLQREAIEAKRGMWGI